MDIIRILNTIFLKIVRRDKFMKKWEKYYISITGVIFIITCIISIIFLRNVSHLSEVTVVIIKMILCLILLLIEVAMVVYFSILGIITMKRGKHNI